MNDEPDREVARPELDAGTGVTSPDPISDGAEAEESAEARDTGSERLRHRERAVSAADYESLATPGFPTVGRATVAAVFALAALALGALLLSQIQGPRNLDTAGAFDPDKLLSAGRTTSQPHETAVPATQTGPPEATAAAATTAPTVAPIEINFNADAYAIERGQCTTLRWRVSGASRITLLRVEREPTAAKEVCPDRASGYTLYAENKVEETSAYLEIAVTAPTEDSGPTMGCTGFDENGQLICKQSCGPNDPNQPCEL